MTPRRARLLRLGILAAAIVALLIVGVTSGVYKYFTVDVLRAQAVSWGAWGVLAYLAAFSAGLFLYVPGMVFLVVAVLAWGQVAGAVFAFVGSLLAMQVTFGLVRGAGGQALTEVKNPFLRKILAQLDAHPVSVVAVLRLIFFTSPVANYALALSSVRTRDYLLGSALGMALPVVGVALFTDSVVRFFGY